MVSFSDSGRQLYLLQGVSTDCGLVELKLGIDFARRECIVCQGA